MSEQRRIVSKHVYVGTTVITNKPCYLHALYASAEAGAVGDVYLYDNATAASGTLAFGIDVKTNGFHAAELPLPGILCINGLTADNDCHSITVVYSEL